MYHPISLNCMLVVPSFRHRIIARDLWQWIFPLLLVCYCVFPRNCLFLFLIYMLYHGHCISSDLLVVYPSHTHDVHWSINPLIAWVRAPLNNQDHGTNKAGYLCVNIWVIVVHEQMWLVHELIFLIGCHMYSGSKGDFREHRWSSQCCIKGLMGRVGTGYLWLRQKMCSMDTRRVTKWHGQECRRSGWWSALVQDVLHCELHPAHPGVLHGVAPCSWC